MTSDFRRARRPEQKQERREAILASARELAVASGVDHVTLGSVATAVGLAKSNVVRYFGTREEIYLVLTGDCWREWRDEVLSRLEGDGAVADTLAETLATRPLFCDLLSHAATSLEHNVSVEAARDYKQAMVGVIGEIGRAVAKAEPSLTDGEAFELVTAAIGLVGFLYPAANPSKTLLELYALEPELAAARPPLLRTMKRMLAAMTAGLPTLRP